MINECIIEIKKSKFLGFLFGVKTKEEITSQIEEIKKQHKKATHICYAYRLKCPFAEKSFDDKEPAHTAGLPILQVLQKKELMDVCIVVVRYFGGIKLGAGGLVRAYTKCASELCKESL